PCVLARHAITSVVHNLAAGPAPLTQPMPISDVCFSTPLPGFLTCKTTLPMAAYSSLPPRESAAGRGGAHRPLGWSGCLGLLEPIKHNFPLCNLFKQVFLRSSRTMHRTSGEGGETNEKVPASHGQRYL